jgi:UDP-glucose:(heptosyl)LPS alpha-1,3-glucosyltransferase
MKRLSFFVNPLHVLTLLSEHLTFEKHPPAAIICNSHLVKGEIEHYYPKTPKPCLVVIHNGVEWNDFEPHFHEKILSSKDRSSPPHLLFIGHEWDRKGLDRLLAALYLMNTIPFHLTAVGRERHPDRFSALASSFNLNQKVTLIPTAQNPIPYYKAAQIAVIPSRYDPFANVTLEALAMGLFVITTKANGGSEAIREGVNGIVLEEDASPLQLCQAITIACSKIQDPLLPLTIRKSVQEFDFSSKLEDYIVLIEGHQNIPG